MTRRYGRTLRAVCWINTISVTGLTLLTLPVLGQQLGRQNEARQKAFRDAGMKPGLTQSLTPEEWAKVDAKRAAEALSHAKDVRPLTSKELTEVKGRGYRNKYFAGTLPWHRSFRDVNVCNGNLFKSFTDIQVSPAKGAGLALQRTYNSQEDRIGPFGQGWTHAYDIRMEEEPPTANGQDDAVNNLADRTDFFGGKHKYHRDADGLYSPPVYLFDELSSEYNTALVNGPASVSTDSQKGMDGTTKHFIAIGNERVCDSITDRFGNATFLTYTTVQVNSVNKGLLQSVTDPSRRQLTFTWSNLGTAGSPAYRITLVQGPQYSVSYEYNSDFNLWKTHLDPTGLNRTTTFGYTTVTGSNGTETGLLNSVSDGISTLSYTYSIGSNLGAVYVSGVAEPGGEDPNTHTARIQNWYLGAPGSYADVQVSAGTGSSGDYFFWVHTDTQLRKTFFWVPSSHSFSFMRTDYDSANNVTSSSMPQVSTGTSITQNALYGPHGNLLKQTSDPYGTPVITTTDYYNGSQYFQKKRVTDGLGRVTTFGVGDKSGADPTDGARTATPGNKGNVLWVRDAGYGVSGNPSNGKQFTYEYNNFGQKVKETNLNGVVSTYTYGTISNPSITDTWGNLTGVVQDAGTGKLNRTTTMSYDVAGHVLQSTDPMGKVASFTYNVLGQPLTANTPARTAADNGGTIATSAETVTYDYGGANTNGRMLSVTDARGTTSLAYELGCDRVKSVTDPVTGTLGYTSNPYGQRTTMTLPGGGTFTYAYNPGGSGTGNSWFAGETVAKDDPNSLSPRLQSVTDDLGKRVEYNPFGSYTDFPISGRLVQAISNQTFDASLNRTAYTQSDYTYDLYYRGNLLALKHTYFYKDAMQNWQSKLLTQNDYTYDDAGMKKTNRIRAGDGTDRTELYGYDEQYRLKTVDYGDGGTQSYAFDAMGNRTGKTDNGTSEGYTFDNANRLLSKAGAAYTNDLDGNTLTGGGRVNSWDGQNRLVRCTKAGVTSDYVYSSDGFRRRVTVGGVTTDSVLDNGMLVRERSGGVNKATYLVGARGPEYRRDDSTGAVRWYLYDGLGSSLGEVDPSGNVTSSRKYDVYGAVRGGVNSGGTSKQKFVGALGHQSDDETGLVYMRARYYDPATGRFISQDSVGSGLNWFIYCSDNPINRMDASGHDMISDIISSIMKVLNGDSDAAKIALAEALVALSQFLLNAGRVCVRIANKDFAYALTLEGLALADSEPVTKAALIGAMETAFASACKAEAKGIGMIFASEIIQRLAYLLLASAGVPNG